MYVVYEESVVPTLYVRTYVKKKMRIQYYYHLSSHPPSQKSVEKIKNTMFLAENLSFLVKNNARFARTTFHPDPLMPSTIMNQPSPFQRNNCCPIKRRNVGLRYQLSRNILIFRNSAEKAFHKSPNR